MLWLWLACNAPSDTIRVDQAWVLPSRRAHHATVAWTSEGPVVAWTTGAPRSRSFTAEVGGEGRELAGRDAAKPDVVASPRGAPWIALQTPNDGLWLEPPGRPARRWAASELARVNASVDLAVAADGPRAVWYDADGLGRASIRGWSADAGLGATPALPAVIATFDDTVRSAPDVACTPDGHTWVAYTEQWLDGPDVLVVDTYAPDGHHAGHFRHSSPDRALMPRRPTVSVGSDGHAVAVFRELDADRRTHGAWLVALDDHAEPLAPARRVWPEADRPVVERLGAATVLVVAEVPDEAGSRIEAARFAWPDFTPLGKPIRVSPEGRNARRPHVAIRADARSAVVSYETAGGRVAVHRLQLP
ncbi:MAG: hypothetical protein AAF211_07655 [Myxococcota bacterium]